MALPYLVFKQDLLIKVHLDVLK